MDDVQEDLQGIPQLWALPNATALQSVVGNPPTVKFSIVGTHLLYSGRRGLGRNSLQSEKNATIAASAEVLANQP